MLFSEIPSISYAVCSCSGTMWVFELQAVAERGRAADDLGRRIDVGRGHVRRRLGEVAPDPLGLLLSQAAEVRLA